MTAYIIWDSAILNEEGVGNYVNLATQSLAPYSGRFLIQGQAPVAVEEGDWPEGRMVSMLEFPNMQTRERLVQFSRLPEGYCGPPGRTRCESRFR